MVGKELRNKIHLLVRTEPGKATKDFPIKVFTGNKKKPLREILDVVYDEETRSLVIILENV